MSLESIKTLRIWSKAHMCSDSEIERFIDAVEREISERYVELPKDADGEYVHVGDLMEDGKKVARIVLTDGEWEHYALLYDKPNYLREYFCGEISHYKPPTLEDVMRDFAIDWEYAADGEDKTAVLKEYAAKLQLKENA